MNNLKALIFSLVLTGCMALTGAQTNTAQSGEANLNTGNLDQQFDYVIDKSNRYRDERGRV